MKNLNRIIFLQYFVLCFCVLLSSCSNDPKIVETFVSSEELPLETIKQAELLYTEKGKVKVKILAQKIERFTKPNPTISFSDGIVVYFYNDSSMIASVLTAEQAIIDERKEEMMAQMNVELVNQKQEKLNTEQLIWNERSNLIFTEKTVRITSKEEIIFGEGFESTPDFSYYRITNVRGSIKIGEIKDSLQ